MFPLARLVDPNELDSAEGPRGRLRVDVLEDWLLGGATIEVVIPSRLICARCEGGGCDGCGRSGGLRVDGAVAEQTIRLSLPSEASIVRLSAPLGANAALDQLHLHLHVASVPSAFCSLHRRPAPEPTPSNAIATGRWLIVLALLALAVAAWMATRAG